MNVLTWGKNVHEPYNTISPNMKNVWKKEEKKIQRWSFHHHVAKKRALLLRAECLLNGYVLIRKFRDTQLQTLESIWCAYNMHKYDFVGKLMGQGIQQDRQREYQVFYNHLPVHIWKPFTFCVRPVDTFINMNIMMLSFTWYFGGCQNSFPFTTSTQHTYTYTYPFLAFK